MSAGLVVREHPGPLPTVPGGAPGIVAVNGRETTAQCAVCYRTATGESPAAVVMLGRWKFEPDVGDIGWTEYRRCPDCVEARRHPA